MPEDATRTVRRCSNRLIALGAEFVTGQHALEFLNPTVRLIDLDDCGRQPRLLIHDRHAKFSRAFDATFQGEGIRVIRTPVRAPNANAHVERWVGGVGASASTGC